VLDLGVLGMCFKTLKYVLMFVPRILYRLLLSRPTNIYIYVIKYIYIVNDYIIYIYGA
jgi:hypothetical protein